MPKYGKSHIEANAEKTWTHCGLKCAVVNIKHLSDLEFSRLKLSHVFKNEHKNGYVQVPKALAVKYPSYNDWPDIDVHGGLTYGPDGARYIGFDTNHWNSGMWTLQDVYEETERLAEQVLALAEEDE